MLLIVRDYLSACVWWIDPDAAALIDRIESRRMWSIGLV